MTESANLRVPDHHVHTEWSWDADHGDMAETCRRALQLGLQSIAFTEHADWVRGEACVVDIAGYLGSIDRCRAAFPELQILSGVELGEPHWHPEDARKLLSVGPLDRVVASVHCIRRDGVATDASEPGFLRPDNAADLFRGYLREVTMLLESREPFEVLAHLDYPKRYWPGELTYAEQDYEDEFRTALRAAAQRGIAIEINTTRGGPVERGLCPGPTVLRWWREEGGKAFAFGSDAHSPDLIAAGFDIAAAMAEAAGFKPQDDPNAFWLA